MNQSLRKNKRTPKTQVQISEIIILSRIPVKWLNGKCGGIPAGLKLVTIAVCSQMDDKQKNSPLVYMRIVEETEDKNQKVSKPLRCYADTGWKTAGKKAYFTLS